MEYSVKSCIKSLDDVKIFFSHLVVERKLNFHPDEDFSSYVCIENGSPSFSADELVVYNKLMREAFRVCKEHDVDIYDVGETSFLEKGDKRMS